MPPNIERDTVAIAFDERYIAPACAMLSSLSHSLRAPRALTVQAVMPEATSRLARQCLASHALAHALRLEIKLVREDFSGLPANERYTRAVYLSLLLPDLLPEAQRIVYLDVDLLVMRDPSELLDVDLGRAPLAAVRDAFITGRPDTPVIGEAASRTPEDAPYFNAGVMVINAEVWRDERIGPRAIAMVQESWPPLTWLDQDALNIMCAGRWKELDARWNVFSISDQLACWGPDTDGECPSVDDGQARLERDAFVLHFAGPYKPWHEDYPRTGHRQLYQRFAEPGWSSSRSPSTVWERVRADSPLGGGGRSRAALAADS